MLEQFGHSVRNTDGTTKNLACWNMRKNVFLTLSRMSLNLNTYEVLQPTRDNRGRF